MRNLLFLLLLLPFFTFSQEEKSNISLSIFVLPEMNGLITSKNSVGKEVVDEKIGFSAGLNVDYRLTDKLAIRSGLGYGLKRVNHIHKGLTFGTDLSPQNGFLSESRVESNITYSEIQLPLALKVSLNPSFFFTVGLQFNGSFADHSTRTIYYGNGDTSELNNQTGVTMNYAPMISFGYTIPKTHLSLEAMVKYYIKEYIITDANQYNIGLKISYSILN